MLIEQIPTSSSSSDAGAESGGRETSFQVHTENPNPSTPITSPPQTSAATPSPAVDEETLRHLDKILRSIPSELDNAATYAVLKAKLGISRSKDSASPLKIKIPPSSPTSPSPSTIQPSPSSLPKTTSTIQTPPTSLLPSSHISPSPSTIQPPPTSLLPNSPISPSPSTIQPLSTFPFPSSPTSPPPTSPLPSYPISPSPSSPIQPMHTSEDTSDKESWGEDYGQPFAIPLLGSGSASTSIHEPHLTKGGEVNTEEVEGLRPLFDYGETEREEGSLSRQTRRMTMDRLLRKLKP